MAYSLDELRRRRHLSFFETRHCNGYFQKVVGLHPLADRVAKLEHDIERKRFSDQQDVVEAKSAAMRLPSWLFPLDVVLTQRRLLDHVARLVRQEKISMIAATDPLYAGLFGYWLKRRTGIPLVVHILGNYDLNFEATGTLAMPRMFPTRFLEKSVIRYVLSRADLVAAGSETTRDYAIAHGVNHERTEVFRVSKNMVAEHRTDPSRRAPLTSEERTKLNLPDSNKLLLTVARLEKVKMVDDSIRALSLVVRAHPDAVLLIAGEGSERNQLELLADQLGVSDRVRFLGLVDQEFLSRLAPGCVVLSPLTGMALFETSMAACPAIAYDCDSSISEIVETDATGVLLELGDWQGMGAAASELLSDRSKYNILSMAMRGRAEQITDEAAIYAHEQAAYDRLLGRDSGTVS